MIFISATRENITRDFAIRVQLYTESIIYIEINKDTLDND